MQIKTIMISLAALYALTGCGGASLTPQDTSYTRTIGKKLFLDEVKTHYYLGDDAALSFKAVDEYGADVTKWVEVTGEIDTSREGTYTLVFKLYDKDHKVTDSVEKKIVVEKNHAPVITLYGGNHVDVYLNENYSDPGYDATDAEDGDLSKEVQVSGSVDTATEGNYTITYRVTDSYGTTSVKERIVRVIPKDDIRVNVLNPDNAAATKNFDLWQYMLAQNSNLSYGYYENNLKKYTKKKSLIERSAGDYETTLPYTLRKLAYHRQDDNSFRIDFMQEQDTLKSVALKESVHAGDIITVDTPAEDDQACRLTDHYNSIELADQRYDDVIKIVCGNEEAYFASSRGLILQNSIHTTQEQLESSGERVSQIPLHSITYVSKIPLGELNLESMQLSHTDMLASDPWNLHGRGIKVGVVDQGNVRDTHVEFGTRVTNLTTEVWNPYTGEKEAFPADSYAEHSTHVAGTIAAEGIDADARGYANEAEIEAVSYYDTIASAFSYGMERFRQRGVYITNHSYDEGNISKTGLYDSFAHKADVLVERFPEVIAIASAGNDRNDTNRYGLIKDFGNAKNIITVGAVDFDKKLTAFSNTGPVKNGRIKPDIVTKGYNVLSVDAKSDDGYQPMSGTSMAAPAVTGAMALLEEAYLRVNHVRMREDTAKAMIANTAEDLGRKGPDYEYGFGLLNSLEAVKVIETMDGNDSLVQIQEIGAEQKHSYDLHLDALREVKMTLCWIDPETGFVPVEELVTDLDIRIIDNDANTVYAFTLDPDNPETVAKQDRFNRLDNVEQIVTKLPRGDYKVIVSVHKAGKEQQKYSLVSNVVLKGFQADSSYSKIDEFETVIYESVAH